MRRTRKRSRPLERVEEVTGRSPAADTYLDDTWITLKEHFVSAWVDKHSHFGHSATSRVEGAHAALKRMIVNAIGNLFTVFQRLHVFLEEQHTGIGEDACKDRRIKKHFYASPLFPPSAAMSATLP